MMQENKTSKPIRIKTDLLDAIEKEGIQTSVERGTLVECNDLIHELLWDSIKIRDASRNTLERRSHLKSSDNPDEQ
jgi:hypothetical protein